MKMKNFAGIDLLRFWAAMLVCFFHLAFMNTTTPKSASAIISGSTYDFAAVHALTSVGWVGVQIFFVISGFVIFGSAKASAGAFARSRFLRLYPAAWICAPISLLISLAYAAYPTSETVTRIVRSMILFPKGNWVDGVYWTLGIEIAFYCVVFVLLALNARRAIVWFCLALGSLSASYWLIFWAAQNLDVALSLQSVLPVSSWGRYFELSLIPHGCYFAIGAVFYVLLCENGNRWLWLAVAYFVLGAVIEIQATAVVQSGQTNYDMNSFLAQSMWLASLVVLVLFVKMVDDFAKPLEKVQSRTLGGITYPLYLLHTTVGAALLSLCNGIGVNLWVALGVTFAMVCFISFVVHRHLERPLKDLTSHILNAGKAALSARIPRMLMRAQH
jgi:peptidoglycan/LPS O-acetylase OafA/YrhL